MILHRFLLGYAALYVVLIVVGLLLFASLLNRD
jgi:hypothetical protein